MDPDRANAVQLEERCASLQRQLDREAARYDEAERARQRLLDRLGECEQRSGAAAQEVKTLSRERDRLAREVTDRDARLAAITSTRSYRLLRRLWHLRRSRKPGTVSRCWRSRS